MESRVLVIGSSGMAGHVIALKLGQKPGLHVIDVGPRRKIFKSTLTSDLGTVSSIERLVSETDPHFVINCIGVLVARSELNHAEAIWYNAYLPNVLSTICNRSSRKLIHLSTDCVFSGKNGPYREDSFRDGNAVYDRTKALGEVANGDDLTIRTSIIGPELLPSGTGLFNWFMKQAKVVTGYQNVLWSGVTTTQIADFIAYVIGTQAALRGIVHYATPSGISKFELLKVLNHVFERGKEIRPVEEPRADKRLNVRDDMSCVPPTYIAQIASLKAWIDSHPELYWHYLQDH